MSIQLSILSITDMPRTGWTHAVQARGTKLGSERGTGTQLAGITNNYNIGRRFVSLAAIQYSVHPDNSP
jgi:hypothetical protein